MRLSTKITATLTSVLLLNACGGGSNYNFDTPVETTESAPPNGPIFDPAAGKLPTTNDLFFQGSTDGTLNIPNTTNNPVIPQINTLDGFSTSNPIIADFGMPLDQASLIVGDSIRIFQVTKDPATGGVTGIVREATAAEFTAAAIGDGSRLALIPNRPLAESTSFMVVLTNKIKGADGSSSVSASAYTIARSGAPLTGGDYNDLEPLRQSVNNHETVAEAGGIEKDSIVLSWSFTTQSITPVMQAVVASAKAEKLVVAPTGQTTNDINSSLLGLADVYIGTLDIPYYLEAPTADNPTAPLTGYWKGAGGSSLTRFNPTPTANTTLTIPVMMTMPKTDAPAEGFPIVMYQHGITRNRTDVLVYADAMAQAGFAVIAIDLPMHGAPKTVSVGGADLPNPFHADNTVAFAETELSFDLDLIDNNTSAPGPDGVDEPSGTHFINLQSLLTSRDNFRQGVANLLTLRRSLGNIMDITSSSVIGIDTDRIGFVAHSLGGMVGTTYLGVETQSLPSSIVSAGAPISKVLQDSASFGPRIVAGLEAQGVTGDDVPAFFQAAQFIVDSADPVNFASTAAANHAIHMIKVVDDGTVPNSTTDILSQLMGASVVSNTVTDIAPGNAGIVTFTEGGHSTPLTPHKDQNAADFMFLDAFTEMHSQMATFQGSGGTTILIGAPDIIQ